MTVNDLIAKLSCDFDGEATVIISVNGEFESSLLFCQEENIEYWDENSIRQTGAKVVIL